MSGNRIEGAAKKASGAIKQAAGNATGNDRLRAKGAAEKAAPFLCLLHHPITTTILGVDDFNFGGGTDPPS